MPGSGRCTGESGAPSFSKRGRWLVAQTAKAVRWASDEGPGVGQSGIPEKVTVEADVGGGAEQPRPKGVKQHRMRNSTAGELEGLVGR